MMSDIVWTPVKFACFFFAFVCMTLVGLAVLFNYQNNSNRNNYEAYALGLCEFAQKNAGFNETSAGSFKDFDTALTNRHLANLPAEIKLTIELNVMGSVQTYTSTKIIGRDNIVEWSGGAINKRLQKGDKFTIEVNPYYRELNTFSDDMHAAENQAQVNGKSYDYAYKGRTIVIEGYAHGYIKEDNVTQNDEDYVRGINLGWYGE